MRAALSQCVVVDGLCCFRALVGLLTLFAGAIVSYRFICETAFIPSPWTIKFANIQS